MTSDADGGFESDLDPEVALEGDTGRDLDSRLDVAYQGGDDALEDDEDEDKDEAKLRMRMTRRVAMRLRMRMRVGPWMPMRLRMRLW